MCHADYEHQGTPSLAPQQLSSPPPEQSQATTPAAKDYMGPGKDYMGPGQKTLHFPSYSHAFAAPPAQQATPITPARSGADSQGQKESHAFPAPGQPLSQTFPSPKPSQTPTGPGVAPALSVAPMAPEPLPLPPGHPPLLNYPSGQHLLHCLP